MDSAVAMKLPPPFKGGGFVWMVIYGELKSGDSTHRFESWTPARAQEQELHDLLDAVFALADSLVPVRAEQINDVRHYLKDIP